jgi:hypothetical protein
MRISIGLLLASATIGCGNADATTPAKPHRLAFTVQPASTVAGEKIGPTVQVAIQDSAGNTDTRAQARVTLSLETQSSSISAPSLSGTTTVTTVRGVATFRDLRATRSFAEYALVATAAGYSPASSQTFAVKAGPAKRLEFAIQPTVAMSGTMLAPAVWIAVRDQFGNFVSDSTTVSLDVADESWRGALVGTTTAASSAGVVVFPAIRVDKAGGKFRLAATAPGIPRVTSGEIEVK